MNMMCSGDKMAEKKAQRSKPLMDFGTSLLSEDELTSRGDDYSVEAVIHSIPDSEASIEVSMAPDWDKPIIYPRDTQMTSTEGWIGLELESSLNSKINARPIG